LRDLVERRYRFRVGLVAAFGNDQLRKLRGNVHIGLLERAAGKCAAASRAGTADVRLARRQTREKFVLTIADQALFVGKGREGRFVPERKSVRC